MAWTLPKTWTAVLVTVADLNTHIRDNLNAINSTPAVRVYNSTNQSITSSVVTELDFDSERFDTEAMHAGSERHLTCHTAGKYLIGANVRWAANATGIRDLGIRLNATTYIAYKSSPADAAASQ